MSRETIRNSLPHDAQRRALIGLPPARVSRAFQFRNVFPVDRPSWTAPCSTSVIASFDSIAAEQSPVSRYPLSVNRPSAPSYLSQYDQQWISAA